MSGICHPVVVFFNFALLDRQEGREGAQVKEVSAGRSKDYGKGLSVRRSGDLEIIFVITFVSVEHVRIVGRCRGIGGALPGILEVGSGQG